MVMPMPSRPLEALTPWFALALFAVALLVPTRADAATFTDGFERSSLSSKVAVAGPVRIQSRISYRGSRALLIPRTRSRAFVTRRFALSGQVSAALSFRRSRRGMQRLVNFPRSRVSVYHDGRRLRVLAGGRIRTVGPRVLAGKSFRRIAVSLNSRTNRLTISTGGRRTVLKIPLRHERQVRLGGVRNRYAPTWVDQVKIVNRSAVALPGGGTSGGTAPSSPPLPGGGTPVPGGTPTPGGGAPGSGGGAPGSGGGVVVPEAGSDRFFADSSIWNRVVSGPVAIDGNSSTLVSSLARQAREAGKPPTLNSDAYSTAVYTVDGSTPEIDIELVREFRPPEIIEQFRGVPLPPEAQAASGTDSHVVVHRPSTDQLWEFWDLRGSGADRTAAWGGRLDGVSTSDGIMTHPAGATASGLPLVGGLITLAELEAGRIDHALAMAIPEVRAEWFTAPANRTDGNVYGDSVLPEGARLRLDPSLDIASLGLPEPTRLLAETAQRHGIILRDISGVVAFYGEDPGPSGSESVYDAFYGGLTPQAVMAAFPWDRLQVLEMDLQCCWHI